MTVPSNPLLGGGGGWKSYAVRLDNGNAPAPWLERRPRQLSPQAFEHYALYLFDPARSTGGVPQHHWFDWREIGRSQSLQTLGLNARLSFNSQQPFNVDSSGPKELQDQGGEDHLQNEAASYSCPQQFV